MSGLAADLLVDLPRTDVRAILLLFGQDLDRLLQDAVRAAEVADAVGFRRACHAIAGAAGAVGATALEAASRQGMALVEEQVTPNGLADAASAVAEAARVVRGELAGLLADLPEA